MQPLHHYGSDLAHNFYGSDSDFLDFYAPAHHDAYANSDDYHVAGLYNHNPHYFDHSHDLELANLSLISDVAKSPTFQGLGFMKRGVLGLKKQNLNAQPAFAYGQHLIY